MTVWDLQSLSLSKDPFNFTQSLKKKIEAFQSEQDLKKAFALHQEVDREISELESLVLCLTAQNIHDEEAKKLQAELSYLQSVYQTAIAFFDQRLANVKSFSEFEKESEFILKEKQQQVSKRLPPEKEQIIHALEIDGFASWEALYHDTVGALQFPVEIDGKSEILSAAQMHNLMHHQNREVRKQVFEVWEKTFQEKKDLFAHILNSLAGFRLSALQLRKRTEFLEEPLDRNRMKRETLDAMWQTVNDHKGSLIAFLEKKAKKMGLTKLDWHDVEIASTKQPNFISYKDAQTFIIDRFGKFSSEMGDYAKKAFAEKTIEAEDRKNKLPGGFCTPFPMSKTSRIFMTWSGTRDNLLTLAHELGHGFHSELLFDRPPLAQEYPMNLAETASTFAEQLIFEGLSEEDRESILEERAIRSVVFLMNIQARFLFEKEFYERRSKEIVTADELSQLMMKAQSQAFGNTLSLYDPTFWASKQHFYFTDLPFYNFPYTFGYLFSLGLFAMAKEQPFGERYSALLKDTGSMSAEVLAKKHLGVDLTQPHFWERAVRIATNF